MVCFIFYIILGKESVAVVSLLYVSGHVVKMGLIVAWSV